MERWKEEVEILRAEIARTKRTFLFFAKAWGARIEDDPDTILALGKNAYCRKMRSMYNRLIGKSSKSLCNAYLM